MAVVNLAVGVPVEDFVGKQGAWVVRDVAVNEEEVVEKQDGVGRNRTYGVSEEDVVRKQHGAVRIGSRWTQEC